MCDNITTATAAAAEVTRVKKHLREALSHAHHEWQYAYQGWQGGRADAEAADEEVAGWWEDLRRAQTILQQAQEREEAARAAGWCNI